MHCRNASETFSAFNTGTGPQRDANPGIISAPVSKHALSRLKYDPIVGRYVYENIKVAVGEHLGSTRAEVFYPNKIFLRTGGRRSCKTFGSIESFKILDKYLEY